MEEQVAAIKAGIYATDTEAKNKRNKYFFDEKISELENNVEMFKKQTVVEVVESVSIITTITKTVK